MDVVRLYRLLFADSYKIYYYLVIKFYNRRVFSGRFSKDCALFTVVPATPAYPSYWFFSLNSFLTILPEGLICASAQFPVVAAPGIKAAEVSLLSATDQLHHD